MLGFSAAFSLKILKFSCGKVIFSMWLRDNDGEIDLRFYIVSEVFYFILVKFYIIVLDRSSVLY